MKVLRDEPAPPADQAAIDGVRPVLTQLTPAGRRKLLALVARQCLEDAAWMEVPLFNDQGQPFSYVMALPRAEDEFYSELTPAMAAEIMRRALTPEDSVDWRVMLAELQREDREESEPARSPGVTGPLAGPWAHHRSGALTPPTIGGTGTPRRPLGTSASP
jgi:hypothetical protein